MITGINEGKVHAFLADEGIARFCTEKYTPAQPGNMTNYFMHLTNIGINKYSRNYIEDTYLQDIFSPNKASKRTLAALFSEILETTNDPSIVKTIKQNIHNLCETTMSALANFVLFYTCPKFPNKEKDQIFSGRPFHIFGIDVLIDSNLKAWLLEINISPSLTVFNRSIKDANNQKIV